METKINKLEDLDKTKNPFKVPENYFENFNQEIMNLLPEKEIQKPQTVSLWDKVKPWIYMAAMFAGLYFMVNFLTKNNQKEQIVSQSNQQNLIENLTDNIDQYWSTVQITEEEFYQYLESQLVDEGYYHDFMYDEFYLY